MRNTLLCISMLAALTAQHASAGLLYDNTSTDTLDTLLFSAGPYTGIGDQLHLTAPANAASASVELFNAGGPGTFDLQLRFFEIGAPVGSPIGATFAIDGVTSTGSDVIDLTFSLGTLAVPQDVIFLLSVANATAGVDVGVNLFEPPTVGSSDNTFLIVENGGFSQGGTVDRNVYFQLSGTEIPEPSSLAFVFTGLAAAALRWKGVSRRPRSHSRRPLPDGSGKRPRR